MRSFRCAFVLLLVLALFPIAAQSAPLVFFVRHAEKAVDSSGQNDPNLSAAGQARAEELAHFFRDAEIKAIFVSEFRRTQETAAPLAKMLGITPLVVPAKDIDGLIKRIQELQVNVLVVGHGDTIPRLVAAFGLAQPVDIPDQEYDDVFVLSRGPTPQLLELHQSK